jgi:hypothetical protein
MAKTTSEGTKKTAGAKPAAAKAAKAKTAKSEKVVIVKEKAPKKTKTTLLEDVIASVSDRKDPLAPMTLPALKTALTTSRGRDFTKTAAKNLLKAALDAGCAQGSLQKSGTSAYIVGEASRTQLLPSTKFWAVDLGDHFPELGNFFFFDKDEGQKFRKYWMREFGEEIVPIFKITPKASGNFVDCVMAPEGHPPLEPEFAIELAQKEGIPFDFVPNENKNKHGSMQYTLAVFKTSEDAMAAVGKFQR